METGLMQATPWQSCRRAALPLRVEADLFAVSHSN